MVTVLSTIVARNRMLSKIYNLALKTGGSQTTDPCSLPFTHVSLTCIDFPFKLLKRIGTVENQEKLEKRDRNFCEKFMKKSVFSRFFRKIAFEETVITGKIFNR